MYASAAKSSGTAEKIWARYRRFNAMDKATTYVFIGKAIVRAWDPAANTSADSVHAWEELDVAACLARVEAEVRGDGGGGGAEGGAAQAGLLDLRARWICVHAGLLDGDSKLAEAQTAMRAAIALAPHTVYPYVRYAQLLWKRLKDVEGARGALEAALGVPASPRGDTLLSEEFEAFVNEGGMGREEALAMLRRATPLQPQSVNILHLHAKLLYRGNRSAELAELLAGVVATEGGQVEWRAYATSLSALWLNNSAAEQYRLLDMGLRLQPDSCARLAHYAAVHEAEGNFEGAMAMYERALAIQPTSSTLYNSLAVLVKRERKDVRAAKKLLEKALQVEPEDPETLFHLAICLHECGPRSEQNADKQIALLDRVLAVRPKDLNAICSKAHLLWEDKGQVEAAKTLLLKVLELDADNVACISLLGRILADKNDVSAAEAQFLKAITLSEGKDMNAVRGYWNMLKETNDPRKWEQAEETLQAMASKHPDNAALLWYLAYCKLKTRFDLEGAKALLLKTMSTHPDNAELLCSFAVFLDTQPEDKKTDSIKQEAGVWYRRALRADPTHHPSLCNYALYLHESCDDAEGARQAYKTALEFYPSDSPLLCNYGFFLQELGDPEAEARFRRAAFLNPTNVDALEFYAGYLQDTSAEPMKAKAVYQQLMRIDPKNPRTMCKYGRLLEDVDHDTKGAEALFTKALELDPQSCVALCNLGTLLQDAKKDHKGAVRMFQKALRINPLHTATLGNYATLCHDVLKDYEQAQVLYRQALTVEPSHCTTLVNYAQLLREVQGKVDEAEGLLLQATDADPTDALPFCALGNLLRDARKDNEGARKAFERAYELDPQNVHALLSFSSQLAIAGGVDDMERAQKHLSTVVQLHPQGGKAEDIMDWLRFLRTAAGGSPGAGFSPAGGPFAAQPAFPAPQSSTALKARKELQRRRERRLEQAFNMPNPDAEIERRHAAESQAETMARQLLQEEDMEKKSGGPKRKPKKRKK